MQLQCAPDLFRDVIGPVAVLPVALLSLTGISYGNSILK
jgi:hypothetical protein